MPVYRSSCKHSNIYPHIISTWQQVWQNDEDDTDPDSDSYAAVGPQGGVTREV